MNTQDKVEDGKYPFYVRSSKVERSNRYTYNGVAILTPGDGAIGQIFHYSEGKIAVHQRVYMLTEIQCVPKYLFYYFSANFFERASRMSAKNTVDSVRMNMITDMPFSLPSLAEQRKIASFLSLIDERIETQRQTIKEQKRQKKALLHQIFSQSLRFPSFSDSWQQTTLGEVAERVIRKNHNNESNRPLTISAQYGLIDQRDFFNKIIASNNLEGYYLLHQGEFAYNRSSSVDYPWGAIKRLDKYSQGVLSTLYICFRITKGNPLFFTYLFDAFKWHNYIQRVSAEGARNHGLLNIAVSDFFDMPISLPSLEEQQKIAEFLSLIDERIEVEETLLQQYEDQKRYLLRKMFV